MIDGRLIGQVIGLLLCALSAIMLIPAIVDAVAGNAEWRIFLGSALATGYLGTSLSFATRTERARPPSTRDAFLITTIAWIVVPGMAALPLWGHGLSVTDAYFESMSGMTTTGSSVIIGLDGKTEGLLLWRGLLCFIGGFGVVGMAIVLLPFLRIGGMQLFHAESSDKSDKIMPHAAQLVGRIFAIYAALTALCAFLFFLFGMSVLDAVCHAMAALATAGFSTHDASFLYFKSPALDWICVVFMLAGALPFTSYVRMLGGDMLAVARHPEVKGLLLLVSAVAAVMALWLSYHLNVSFLTALRYTMFNVVSIVTTTGFMNADYVGWGPQVFGIFLVLTVIGGCSGSTAGAIKMLRFQILWLTMQNHLHRLLSPNRIMSRTYQGRPLTEDVMQSVMAFLTLYLGTIAVFTIVLSAMGLDLVTALTATATAVGNVGPGLGPIIGPAGNFATLPDAAKWILSLAMMLGRLELFTVLVLVLPAFWR